MARTLPALRVMEERVRLTVPPVPMVLVRVEAEPVASVRLPRVWLLTTAALPTRASVPPQSALPLRVTRLPDCRMLSVPAMLPKSSVSTPPLTVVPPLYVFAAVSLRPPVLVPRRVRAEPPVSALLTVSVFVLASEPKRKPLSPAVRVPE